MAPSNATAPNVTIISTFHLRSTKPLRAARTQPFESMGFLPQFCCHCRPASVAGSTKVGCGVFLSPAEYHAGCADRTPFSSACSNGRSNYYLSSSVRLFIHRPIFAHRRSAMLFGMKLLPQSSPARLPAVTNMVSLHRSNPEPLMSALGHKRTLRHLRSMSALPPKADIRHRRLLSRAMARYLRSPAAGQRA